VLQGFGGTHQGCGAERLPDDVKQSVFGGQWASRLPMQEGGPAVHSE
jgi:hypothetical protein